MGRTFDAGLFTIPNGQQFSNEISTQLSDASEIIVYAPAVLAEADVQLQVWNGSEWRFYDAANHVAGGHLIYEPRGLKYRVGRRAGTVAAQRDFEVVKQVGE